MFRDPAMRALEARVKALEAMLETREAKPKIVPATGANTLASALVRLGSLEAWRERTESAVTVPVMTLPDVAAESVDLAKVPPDGVMRRLVADNADVAAAESLDPSLGKVPDVRSSATMWVAKHVGFGRWVTENGVGDRIVPFNGWYTKEEAQAEAEKQNAS